MAAPFAVAALWALPGRVARCWHRHSLSAIAIITPPVISDSSADCLSGLGSSDSCSSSRIGSAVGSYCSALAAVGTRFAFVAVACNCCSAIVPYSNFAPDSAASCLGGL